MAQSGAPTPSANEKSSTSRASDEGISKPGNPPALASART